MAPSPDEGYRWATVTPDDRAGILYIAAFLSFTYTGFAFLVRCFIKWRAMGLDDGAFALAQAATVIQFALLLVSLSAGLAKNFNLLTDASYAKMVWFQYGNQITVYIALGTSKLATILLTQRLFTRDMKKAWITCCVVVALIVAWTISAPILASAGCSPASIAPKTAEEMCTGLIARYNVIVTTDALTDLVLVVIPAYLCWTLQMNITIKLQVLAVFSFRLPLIVLSGLFAKTWERSMHSDNPGVHRTSAIIYQQSQLCCSLIAATIPCMQSFIRSFDTGSGMKAGLTSSHEYSSGGRSSSNRGYNPSPSYHMGSFKRGMNSTANSQSINDDNDGEIRVNPRPFASGRSSPTMKRSKSTRDETDLLHVVRDPDRESQGSTQELFIRKDVQWEITRARARRGSDTLRPGMLKLDK